MSRSTVVSRLSCLVYLLCLPTMLSAQLVSSARRDSAVSAFARGLMPLRSSGVDRFAADHPAWDGTGVLIAILDSGIDPGVPGLGMTSKGSPKILDLRDFSGEGRIPLHRIERRGDTLIIGGRHLLGASRVASVAGSGSLWGGTLAEASLGKPPASDLNGNGSIGDTLLLVVAPAQSGWVVFADTKGTGTLDGENPVRDFAVAHEFFAWSSAASGGAAGQRLHLAVNLADSAGVPTLDLFFDTSSHGTHVAGIAAAHDMYGVKGFDGVAPGANLIGLKISDDAHGAVSVTGSMLRALAYAIKFASDRSMPLVVNLSFGVGNEVDGTARIDAMIDSLLAQHPDVVMTVAAGNDGPGLSTLGFPGSASRVISVGATFPLAFLGIDARDSLREPVASFSSRGGEIAGPDIVVPGAAFSTVPSFAAGEELETGTSMASPYAAGLAARLVSGLRAANRTVPAYVVRQALRVSGTMLPSGTAIDEGSGLPDLNAAWQWLATPREFANVAVDVDAIAGRGAIYLNDAGSSGAPSSLSARVVVRRLDGGSPVTLRIRSSVDWVQVPESVTLSGGRGEFTVRVRPAVTFTGMLTAAIRLEGPDETAGPVAIIPVSVRNAVVGTGTRLPITLTPPAGAVSRLFVPADTGRGVQIEIATLRPEDHVTAALHEPGGMPFRDGATVTAGFGDGAGLFDVTGSDAVNGWYEVDVIGSPVAASTAKVTVRQAPLRLNATMQRDTLRLSARSLAAASLSVRLRAGLIGAERRMSVTQGGDAPVRLAVFVPAWATHVAVDTRMPREAWSRFTDFGLSFLDRHGKLLDATPINYAFSRASPDLPDGMAGDSLVLLLSPGFADPADRANWSLDLSIRFYVATPYSLDAGGSPYRPLAAGALREERFHQDALPIALPRDFRPLLTIVALEGSEHMWSREMSVAPPEIH
jgi:subtilisin family serine protease